MRTEIQLKRVFDPPGKDDGYRILVDRLWPRGVSKAVAQIDLWAKELTPSTKLRQWFHAESGRRAEFADRYLAELSLQREKIKAILASVPTSQIVLVTATPDLVHGHAAILLGFLRTIMPSSD